MTDPTDPTEVVADARDVLAGHLAQVNADLAQLVPLLEARERLAAALAVLDTTADVADAIEPEPDPDQPAAIRAERRPHECPHCGKGYTTERWLTRHINTEHSDPEPTAQPAPPPPPPILRTPAPKAPHTVGCTCGHRFTTVADLDDHIEALAGPSVDNQGNRNPSRHGYDTGTDAYTTELDTWRSAPVSVSL